MAVNRKLRFLSLGGNQEVHALEGIMNHHSDDLIFDSHKSASKHIINSILLSVSEGKKLALVLSDSAKQNLDVEINKVGLPRAIWEFDHCSNRELISQTISNNTYHAAAKTDGIWNQLYNLQELWNYRQEILQKKALGENTLEHTLTQWIQLDWKKEVFKIDTRLDVTQFDFNTKEYWFLRGRINQGHQVYQESFQHFKGLTDLHPVFFDMYSAEEAYLVVYELIRKIGEQVNHWKEKLDDWIERYRVRCYQSMDSQSTILRKRLLDLRQGIAEFLELKNELPKQSSWSFLGNTSSQTDEENDFIEAYSSLLKWMDEKRLVDHTNLLESRDIDLIYDMIQTCLSQFGSFRRKMKKAIDEHLIKMNRHTIKDENLLAEFTQINTGIKSMISEINGYQIFKDHWEDHSLELRSQITMMDQLKERVSHIQLEIGSLKEYIHWNQFMQTLDQKGQLLLEMFFNYSKDTWIDIFDAWYLGHYIACQDILNLGSKHYKEEWKPLMDKAIGQQLKYTTASIESHVGHRSKSFLKTHKSFNKWVDKGAEYDDLTTDQALFNRCFPVVFFSQDEAKEALMYEADVIITDMSNMSNYTCVQKIQIKPDRAPSSLNPPTILSNILYSKHTERIDDIHEIASFILKSPYAIDLWQNKHQVILTMTGGESKKLLNPGLAGKMTRVSLKSSADLDLLTEALINNHGRNFDLLWSELPSEESNPYSAFGTSVFLETLERSGFGIHYLCWTKWIENKEIVNYLIQQKEAVVYQKNTPTHLA